jgi:hypothetical protein
LLKPQLINPLKMLHLLDKVLKIKTAHGRPLDGSGRFIWWIWLVDKKK